MKLPRDLSGRELISCLEKAFAYQRVHQEGSHVVLHRQAPRPHRIAVPDHKTLRVGTLNAILRAVARAQGLSKEETCRRLFG